MNIYTVVVGTIIIPSPTSEDEKPLHQEDEAKEIDAIPEDDSDDGVMFGPVPPPAKRSRPDWIERRLQEPYTPLVQVCCRKRCTTRFPDDLCADMREEVWGDDSLTKAARRDRIRWIWKNVFVSGDNRIQACLKFILNVFGIVRGYLYYKEVGTPAVRQADKTLAVILWFDRFRDICDPIPNEDNQWQVYAPNKKYVHEMYMAESTQQPDVWPAVSEIHFLRTWRKFKQEFRLRKHLRFTKCGVCVKTREALRTGRLSDDDRASLEASLQEHYQRIRLERAEAKGNPFVQFRDNFQKKKNMTFQKVSGGQKLFQKVKKKKKMCSCHLFCVVCCCYYVNDSKYIVCQRGKYYTPRLTCLCTNTHRQKYAGYTGWRCFSCAGNRRDRPAKVGFTSISRDDKKGRDCSPQITPCNRSSALRRPHGVFCVRQSGKSFPRLQYVDRGNPPHNIACTKYPR